MSRPAVAGNLARRMLAMSGPELGERLRQETAQRLDAARYRIGIPARREAMPGSAPAGQFFFDSGESEEIVALIKRLLPDAVEALDARAHGFQVGCFDLLGYRGLDFGRNVDWALDPVHGKRAPLQTARRVPYLDFDVVGDHKVVWELNRHQFLLSMVRAWRLTGKKQYARKAAEYWRDWRQKNPYPLGINWASSLEAAFRAMSWLWIYHLLDTPGRRRDFDDWRQELLPAIGHSAACVERYLSTYFSPNTHLLGEATALYEIGVACPGFSSAGRWRETGRRLVIEAAQQQVRRDGLHFERSLYYHVYALDLFQHFSVLASRADDELPEEFKATTEAMAAALATLSAGGVPPRFGDDDGGRVFDGGHNRPHHLLEPLATAAGLFGRADFAAAAGGLSEESLWLLGARAENAFAEKPGDDATVRSKGFAESGVYMMTTSESQPQAAVVQAGPRGGLSGGHGHADALSLEWIQDGNAWLADPGAGLYPQAAAERDRFRSSAAHNVVQVDGESQAVPSGPFAWESFPETTVERWVTGVQADVFAGRHDGYRRLSSPATCRRWVISIRRGGALLVRDVVEGKGRRTIESSWHLGPQFKISALMPDSVRFETSGSDALSVFSPRRQEWSRAIWEGEHSERYGEIVGAPVVQYRAEDELPLETAVVFAAGESGQPSEGALETLQDGRGQGVSVYRWKTPERTLLVIFSDRPGEWKWKDWTSDAALLWIEGEGSAVARAFAIGTSVWKAGGAKVFEFGSSVERWECECGPKRERIWSSAPETAGKANFEALRKLVKHVTSL